jgi:hypothetical protein
LCPYWPVSIDAREGQQSGVVTKAFSNRVPVPSTRRVVCGITSGA